LFHLPPRSEIYTLSLHDALPIWGAEGHMICNHTYSHWFYPNRSFEEFSQDALRLEPLIKDVPGFTKRFRFPALKEGDTIERRDRSEEHTSELQSLRHLVCRLLLE